MLAGYKDALSLTSIGLGVQLANPLIWSVPVEISCVLAASGGTGILLPRAKKLYNDFVTKSVSGVLVESDKAPPVTFLKEGYRMGVTRDHYEPVDLHDERAVRHNAIVGQSGVGKTTLAMYILSQQMVRGGGFIFVDAKIDRDTLERLSYLANKLGREDELYVLDVSTPSNSHSYNPLLAGDADEKASRIMNLQPSTDNNAGADHYRQTSAYVFNMIFQALDELKYSYTFQDLVLLMQNSKALLEIERKLPEGNVRIGFSSLLEQYKKKTKQGVEVDIEKFKTMTGGMVGRLAMFANGKFGDVFNTTNPEIDLYDIITNNKMLYVMVPTMGKDTAALNLAKMIISDLRSATARIQELPEYMRPFPYFLFLGDEFGSYAIEQARTLFEQSRSAHIQMWPAFQSFSQLNNVSPEFSDIIIQNTWNKVFFKFGSKDAPEDAAEILGKQVEFIETITASNNEGSSAQSLRTNPEESGSEAGGISKSWREQEGFRVHPDQLRSLEMGQAILQSGADVFCLDTPMIKFPKKLPPFKKVHYTVKKDPTLTPLNLAANFMDYISQPDTPTKPQAEVY